MMALVWKTRGVRVLVVAFAIAGAALLPGFGGWAAADDDEDAPKRWQELEIQLPPLPKQDGLAGFFVSSATNNRFFVDPSAISVGDDGVVRYTLVVESDAGVRNVSYEGMRCETREKRLYAFGRGDGTWSKSRNDRWERVREATNNRHHAALFQDYFCPGGVIVRNADDARAALRRGGHPAIGGW